MSNIVDYVKWRGDLSFDERPFNIIDNLVFAQMGYLSLIDIPKDTTDLTIKKAWDIIGENAVFKQVTRDADSNNFFKACALSKRFGNIRITDYEDDTSISENKQFAAVTFHINDKQAIISYRGTDETIIGWKEDFMISYCKVQAQELALKYAQRMLQMDKQFYITGHSKGANLSLYAAAHLNDAELAKVDKVYLNDGPGFCQDVLDTSLISKIDSKCVRITPHYCIVGAIFDPQITESYIVKSNASQMLQHGVLSWQINENGLDQAPEHDAVSEHINKLFDKFIEKMDNLQDRQAFVNSIFDTMGQNGAVTIEDFMKKGPAALENLLVTVVGENEEGLNPLKTVKNNVVEDIKQTSFAKIVEKGIEKKSAIRVVVGIIIAVCCYIVPENFIETIFAILLFIMMAYQIFLTIYHLRKNKWNLNKERIRVNISITMIVAYAIIIVKDEALFLLSSILFGIFFLIASYQNIIKYKDSKDSLCKKRYIIEAIMSFIYGGYLVVSPDVGLQWYTISCGTFFLLDAIFELIHIYRVHKGTVQR